MNNQVKSHNNYQKSQPGLNGLFSWLRRTVNNILNAVSEISHNPFFLFTVFEDAFDGGGFNLGNDNPGEFYLRTEYNQDIELTVQEEIILDNWVEQRFKPLFLSYFSQLKEFSQTTPRLNDFKVFYKNAYEFIGYINWSIANVSSHISQPFLSENVLRARNEFLNIQMQLLVADIEGYISVSNFSFSTRDIQEAVNTSKYQVLDFNVNQTVSIIKRDFIQGSFVGSASNQPINDETPITYNTNQQSANSNTNRNALKIALMFGIGFLLPRLIKSNGKETDN